MLIVSSDVCRQGSNASVVLTTQFRQFTSFIDKEKAFGTVANISL